MKAENKNLQDFEFIIGEINRFINEMNADVKKSLADVKKSLKDTANDALYSLPHPSGSGLIIIGHAGKKGFYKIAERLFKSYPQIEERATAESLVAAIEYIFCEEILKRRKPLTASLADKMTASAIKHIQAKKLKTVTHYFPCILPDDTETEEFSVGSVTFQRTKKLLEVKENKLASYTKDVEERYLQEGSKKKGFNDAEKEKIVKFSKSYVEELHEYYKKYPWVARVEIENFETVRSKEAASLCVNSALNIIRLFLPPTHAEDIYLCGSLSYEPKTASMSEENESIDISWSRGAVFLTHEGWVRKCLGGEGERWITLAGCLIPFLVSGEPIPPLYQRYLNALWWYGEALLTTVPYLKIIALSNALEAFLSTTEKNGKIVSQVSTRAQKFLTINTPHENWGQKISKFYDMRSALVHGRTAAFDRKVSKQISIGIMMTRDILMQGLSWTEYAFYKGCRNDMKKLDQLFESDLISFSDGTLKSIKSISD